MPHEAHDIDPELLDQLNWRRATAATEDEMAVELAMIPSGLALKFPEIPRGGTEQALAQIALRRAGDVNAPVVLYTKSELEAFIGGTQDGEFDDLVQ